MIEDIVRILIYGAVISGMWALVSSGFTLIFGVSRILNFAHGTFFILAAYFAITLYNAGVNLYVSVVLGVLLIGSLAVAIYRFLLAPIREHEVMVIIVTLALALLFEQIILLTYGEHGVSLPSFVRGVVRIYDVPVTYKRILTFVFSIVILIILEIFINKTRTGKMINAASQNYEGAMLIGINVEKIFMVTMFISAVLAGFAGIFYAQIFSANPFAAIKSLIFAFAIVILGGLGSVKGSIIASFIVGYVLATTIMFLGARWAEFVVMLLIIAVLIFKPTGLFGVEE